MHFLNIMASKNQKIPTRKLQERPGDYTPARWRRPAACPHRHRHRLDPGAPGVAPAQRLVGGHADHRSCRLRRRAARPLGDGRNGLVSPGAPGQPGEPSDCPARRVILGRARNGGLPGLLLCHAVVVSDVQIAAGLCKSDP